MIELSLNLPPRGGHVLCLGAHPDDIEIGAAGTLATLVRARPDVSVSWIVLASCGPREAETRRAAELLVGGARALDIDVRGFRDSFFPCEGREIKEYFERLAGRIEPDVVLTHRREDLHQDHRLVSELTWSTFRNHLIVEYEIPKYDGDTGTPNCYVPVHEDIARTKLDCLMQSFPSQRDKHWFTEETFSGLMRLRGVECRSESGFAEGFWLRKAVLRP